jgi:RNA polymerase sigma-70 factor (ECF subfamily)
MDDPNPRSGAPASRLSPEDLDLLARMKAGDQDAFAQFYDRFAPGLFSMIFAILRDQKESEDVLQDAFVQMWKRLATFDPTRSNLFTWAVMISRHKAIDRLRARNRQTRLVEAVVETKEVATQPGRAETSLPQDERDRVRRALAQLNDGQREAIDLAFFAGLTQSEIAEKLGAPLGTVKARIRRGLLALRDHLAGFSP